MWAKGALRDGLDDSSKALKVDAFRLGIGVRYTDGYFPNRRNDKRGRRPTGQFIRMV
jgi:hypothetical protein